MVTFESSAMITQPLTSLKNETLPPIAFPMCNNKIQNMLRLLNLGKQILDSSQINFVYSYSRNSANALQLLSNLIEQQGLQVNQVSDTLNSETPMRGTTLFIGGPKNEETCDSNHSERLAVSISHLLDDTKHVKSNHLARENLFHQNECSCTSWSYQFLTTQDEQQSTELSMETTTKPPAKTTTTTTTTSTSTTTTTTSSTTTTTMDVMMEVDETTMDATDSLETTTLRDERTRMTLLDDSTPSIIEKENDDDWEVWTTTDQVPDIPDAQDHFDDGYEIATLSWLNENTTAVGDILNCLNMTPLNKTFSMLAIALGILGITLIITTFSTYVHMLRKSDQGFHSYETMMPMGFLFLYLSIASFGVKTSWTICLLQRSLPGKLKTQVLHGAIEISSISGIGFALTFIGMILQLLHDLNKNVYTVNPENVFRCGFSREDGLFVIGLLAASVQVTELRHLASYFFSTNI